MGLQVLIIFVGGSPLHIVNRGLSGLQWLICFGFSAITFVVSALVKKLPIDVYIDKIIEKYGDKEDNQAEDGYQ